MDRSKLGGRMARILIFWFRGSYYSGFMFTTSIIDLIKFSFQS